MDKQLLFTPRLTEDGVELGGLGTVRVRALNRLEAGLVQRVPGGWEAQERKMLALGMVDPKITEDEALRWQEAGGAGEIQKVTQKISELSGMTEEAPKSGVPGDGGGPGPGVRALPGGAAVDDGGPASGVDEQ